MLVHGPGDVEGDPILLDDAFIMAIGRMYRLSPTGKRVVKRYTLSRAKGRAKSELAAMLAIVEVLGPSRFDHWATADEKVSWWGYHYTEGEPVGKPPRSPLVRCLATEEGQAGNTYANVVSMLKNGPIAELVPKIDAGDTRTYVYGPEGKDPRGEIRPQSAAAGSKEGGKETFAVADEALALDTPLPTPTGWVTMGDVAVGQHLIGADGHPVRVAEVLPIRHDQTCWRVRFCDGSSIIASDGHLWETRVASSAAKQQIRTTGQMVRDGRRFMIPRTKPTETPNVDLPIDPYVLGLWLGDGDRTNATISASVEDAPNTSAEIRKRGYTAKYPEERQAGRPAIIYISLPGSHRNRFSPVEGLKVRLRKLDLLGNKHIPTGYLRAGTEQRTELLRGLMDSDGWVSKVRGSCVFVQADRGIVDSVVELLRSLGQEAFVTWRADARATTGGCFKVSFQPAWGIVPFSLSRKADLVRGSLRKGPDWVAITSITPADSVPVRCIRVESDDHLFAAGVGWHLTHNCHLFTSPQLKSMYETVDRNCRKRVNAWMLNTTTAYLVGEGSVAEQLDNDPPILDDDGYNPGPYDHVDATTKNADGIAVVASLDDLKLDGLKTRRQPEWKRLRAALNVAYESSSWMDLDSIIREEFAPARKDNGMSARYFLNIPQRVQSWGGWLRDYPQAWAACLSPLEPVLAAKTWLAVDGSINRDSTSVAWVQHVEGRLVVRQRCWTPSESGGRIPMDEVRQTVRDIAERFELVEAQYDPRYFAESALLLQDEGYPMIELPQSQERMTPICGAAAEVLLDGRLAHDGDPILTRHVHAAAKKPNERGFTFSKVKSGQHIDAWIAAVMALDAALAPVKTVRRPLMAFT